MFDLPVAKRVCRADLYSPPSSPEPSEPDHELTAALYSRLETVYGPAFAGIIPPTTASKSAQNTADDASLAPIHNEHEKEEGGYEFCLFAFPSRPRATSSSPNRINATAPPITTRIILADDVEDLNGRGGFTVQNRDPGYYFSAPPTTAQKRAFELAAMSGEDLQVYTKVQYSGWAMPWRVMVLRDGVLYSPIKQIAAEEDRHGCRDKAKRGVNEYGVGDVPGNNLQVLEGRHRHEKRKPNKKRRIILRTRQKKLEEDKQRREREKRDREIAEKQREEKQREKRTRKNREKKVKKRLKEKAKKESETRALATTATAAAITSRDGSDPSDRNSIE